MKIISTLSGYDLKLIPSSSIISFGKSKLAVINLTSLKHLSGLRGRANPTIAFGLVVGQNPGHFVFFIA